MITGIIYDRKNDTNSSQSNYYFLISGPTLIGISMNTLIIGNQTVEQRDAAIIKAWKTGKPAPAARLDFRNLEDALHLLTEKRWHILKEMTGAGPLAIREIARRMKRDVRAVHSDITQLYRNGVIDKTEDGKMILPYEVIRLDFTFDARKAA